jgi:hypothetical protein
MSCELLTPFTQALRRSAIKGESLLTGRWAAIDANGQAVAPGAGSKRGLNLVLEGTHIHTGSNLDFGSAAAMNSTKNEELPSVKAVGAVALAYGVFRYKVGPEGCDPAQSYTVGDLLDVDAYGRLIPASDDGDEVGRVEAVATDANGVTELVVHTLVG